MKVGRNEPCPCGSGKKYKKCCLLTETNKPQASIPIIEEETKQADIKKEKPDKRHKSAPLKDQVHLTKSTVVKRGQA